jgi:hypothetical protein
VFWHDLGVIRPGKQDRFGLALWLAIAGLGASSVQAGKPMNQEERVRAFIADYQKAHAEYFARNADTDFDTWRKVIEKLDAAHFVDRGGMEMASSTQNPSPHQVGLEKFIRNERTAAGVFVETVDRGGVDKYYEYEMREVNGDWRIVRIREYLDAVDESFMNAKERAAFENPPLVKLRALPKSEAAFDGTALFQAGRSVTLDGKTTVVEVKRLGLMNVSSGVIVAGDFGYDALTLSPLGLRVPPGQYPVDLAVGFGRAAALRLKISDHAVAHWHPADMAHGGHVVGVDAGNVSFSDASALLAVKARDKERAFERFAESREKPLALMLTLLKPNDVAISETGYGDGGYPVYWGLDAAGKPAVLIVDYFVLTRLPEDEDE